MTVGGEPTVSFVVPCYNYGRYLPDCLASIFGQEGGHDFEVVAIDDASTDNTPEVLRSFTDPRLRVLTHTVNLGHVATINEGLRAARGRFIARIDPDDRYRPCFLSATLPKFDVFPEVGLVYGDAAIINDRGEQTCPSCDRVHGGRDFRGNELVGLLEENFICAPTVIARREAWLRALPVPDGLAFNDWYFNLMIARAHDSYYVHQVLADYRVHAVNHHTLIVRNRTEEPSIFRLLDRIYQETEPSSELERRKRAARRRVYALHYLRLADKYFGAGMEEDARRCYWRAARYRPDWLLRPGPFRRLAATYLGRRRYERIKAFLRPAASMPGEA